MDSISLRNEKQSQNQYFLNKIDSKYSDLVKKIIIEYDSEHSMINFFKKHNPDLKMMISEVKKALDERKEYLNLVFKYF
jgi:ribosome biogenesis protein Nip4